MQGVNVKCTDVIWHLYKVDEASYGMQGFPVMNVGMQHECSQ